MTDGIYSHYMQAVNQTFGEYNNETTQKKNNRTHIFLYFTFMKMLLFSPPSIAGFVGGSHYTHPGSASEYLCLPSDPQWGIYRDGHDGVKALVYGAEYETYTYNENFAGMHDHDVPCAVCLVHNRSVVRMFPGKIIQKECYEEKILESCNKTKISNE